MANRADLLAQLGVTERLSDGELILRLYERFGDEMASRIFGSLTWVLWDERRQRLFAARDRAGCYNLFYSHEGGGLYLSHRMGPLLESLDTSPGWNPRALVAHMHAYPPPAGETAWEGVRALPPGGCLAATRDDVHERSYWTLESQPLLRLGTDENYAEHFRERLYEVVTEYAPKERAGLTLSGGCDSTSVAAALHERSPELRVTALRWIAPELPEADEDIPSAAVCRRLGLPQIEVRADRHWSLSRDPGIRAAPEGPLFNLYSDVWDATFDKAREHGLLTVLTGHCGDALFGGNVYSFPDLLLTGRWGQLGREAKQIVAEQGVSPWRLLLHTLLAPMLRAWLPLKRWTRLPPVPWLGPGHRDTFRGEMARAPRLLLPGRRDRLLNLRGPFLPPMTEVVTRLAADRGVELRHPYQDHRLFELAATYPTDQAIRAGERKMVIRHAMRGRLPEAVVGNRGKIYPTAFADRGLREREQSKVWDLLTDMRAADAGLVDQAEIRRAYQSYQDGGPSQRIWYTLTLEAWLREYFD